MRAGSRSVLARSARATAAAAVPARSMSTRPGTPTACARRSAPVICSAVIGGSAFRSAHRRSSSSRSRPSSSVQPGTSTSSGEAARSGTVAVISSIAYRRGGCSSRARAADASSRGRVATRSGGRCPHPAAGDPRSSRGAGPGRDPADGRVDDAAKPLRAGVVGGQRPEAREEAHLESRQRVEVRSAQLDRSCLRGRLPRGGARAR